MYLKYWLSLLLCFLSGSIACMNSTENRQAAEYSELKREVEKALTALWNQAYHRNDIASAAAYEIFMAFVDDKECLSTWNSEVRSRLKECNLADDKGIIHSDKVEAMRSKSFRGSRLNILTIEETE